MQNTTDKMHRRYLKTVEAICAVALTGKIQWPVHQPGNREYGDYFINFGTLETLDMADLQHGIDVASTGTFKSGNGKATTFTPMVFDG